MQQNNSDEERSNPLNDEVKGLAESLILQGSFIGQKLSGAFWTPNPCYKEGCENAADGQEQVGRNKVVEVENAAAKNADVAPDACG